MSKRPIWLVPRTGETGAGPSASASSENSAPMSTLLQTELRTPINSRASLARGVRSPLAGNGLGKLGFDGWWGSPRGCNEMSLSTAGEGAPLPCGSPGICGRVCPRCRANWLSVETRSERRLPRPKPGRNLAEAMPCLQPWRGRRWQGENEASRQNVALLNASWKISWANPAMFEITPKLLDNCFWS